MKLSKLTIAVATTLGLISSSAVQAEVIHRQINAENLIVHVSDEPWQPEGFRNGMTIPAAHVYAPGIVIDGKADEAAWNQAVEVEVPITYGASEKVFLKALYNDEDVYIRVRWADDDENRLHHPWVWDAEQQKYVVGPQIEDSVMLSFEAGCEWQPSFLAGYIFDFDGWHWMAARSDPLGQAVDLYGNVQDQDLDNPLLTPYPSRQKRDTWNVKFTENADPDLHAGWDDLDRVYMLQPVTPVVYYQGVPDGVRPPPFVKQMPAPEIRVTKYMPQYVPVELTDGAGEVSAKGQWADGYWTVEFRRDRITPANTLNDTVFNRLVQFSVHVFDSAENINEASISERLFLQFLPEGERLVSN